MASIQKRFAVSADVDLNLLAGGILALEAVGDGLGFFALIDGSYLRRLKSGRFNFKASTTTRGASLRGIPCSSTSMIRPAPVTSNGHYMERCNEEEIKPHPARYPVQLPDFFIRFLTEAGDTVLDPFAGSNTSGEACEVLKRKWIAVESDEGYLAASKFRFEESPSSNGHAVLRGQEEPTLF